jgi:hypothetical protein
VLLLVVVVRVAEHVVLFAAPGPADDVIVTLIITLKELRVIISE